MPRNINKYTVLLLIYLKMVELLGEENLPLNEYIEILKRGLVNKGWNNSSGLDQVVVSDIERTIKQIKAVFYWS